jgi:hypothetical protein
VAVCGAIAPFLHASPTGIVTLDWAWSIVFAAGAAYLGTTSKRGSLLAVVGLAVLSARTGGAITFAALGLGFAILSTRHLRRRAVLARGAAAGAGVLSLLAGGGRLSWLHLAIVSGAIAVLLLGSAYRSARPRARRQLRWLAAAAVAGGVAIAGLAGLGLAANAHRVDVGTSELRLGLAAARAGLPDEASQHLAIAEASLRSARDGVNRWGAPAFAFPVASQNLRAVTSVLRRVEVSAGDAVRAAMAATDDQLVVTDGQMDLAAVSRLANPLRRLSRSLGDVLHQIGTFDDMPIVPQLRDKLDLLRHEASRAHHDARLGSEAATSMPVALGRDAPKRYLVVFTSPSEARGRFGFPSSFAEVTLDDGRIQLGEHGSTSQAFGTFEATVPQEQQGEPGLRPYVPYGAGSSLLSSTIPPDFRVVARTLTDIWEQTGRPPLDGVVRFDPESLAALMESTGPVQVAGVPDPLTPDNLVEFLQVGQYVQLHSSTAARREVLDTVAEVTFERLQTADLPSPRVLFARFGPLARAGHLQADASGSSVAGLLGRAGIDGRFDGPTSDGLMVTTVNRLGNKVDAFLQTALQYSGTASRGRAATTAKVTVTNGAPSSGLPDYVIGSFVQPAPSAGTNRGTVLIYTALPASRIDAGGGRFLESTQTQGWWLHEVEVEVPPGGSVTITLDLAGDLPPGPYELLVAPGGGTRPTDVAVDLTAAGRQVRHRGRADTPLVLG